ncbi:MAG: NADH-quinone oxidoreductase subunit NuoK [Candidatus Eisenbacteria bacterium]|uniref:NADH-quinone oxidoreductase subunit K n=1 Tax=Eiseniibacteriota bacterium TaxID=2212470 RepID=A0A948RT84_UNCEI|nr:NADH-quinone oxidoreductase subunit NuoK [Candidatus Eisenbacteria bacterium]MBU1949243.1 NADH-quinone oxidoreductase subunit NuoK [Candidatus Eisenbacteria bacterium]MBU2689581.1 NADH-quinone oxidoreductase subunit NuoK [Candidatus Eisenbacteria bacterium]
MIGLQSYLSVGAILFVLGVYTVLTRRNAVMILMGIELILNSANINFIAFARYLGPGIDGQVVALFVIVLAAAEAAIALAIILNIFRLHHNINVDEVDSMKG